MQKKIEKEFWVSDLFFENLKRNEERNINICRTSSFCKKVTISWEEPEKKIELTESQFDELEKEDAFEMNYHQSYGPEMGKKTFKDGTLVLIDPAKLKQKLFGE